MIVTKSDLREYIQEDQRMQPWPSNPLKRIIGAGGAMVRWKVYLRKCDYHHNVSQNCVSQACVRLVLVFPEEV